DFPGRVFGRRRCFFRCACRCLGHDRFRFLRSFLRGLGRGLLCRGRLFHRRFFRGGLLGIRFFRARCFARFHGRFHLFFWRLGRGFPGGGGFACRRFPGRRFFDGRRFFNGARLFRGRLFRCHQS